MESLILGIVVSVILFLVIGVYARVKSGGVLGIAVDNGFTLFKFTKWQLLSLLGFLIPLFFQ